MQGQVLIAPGGDAHMQLIKVGNEYQVVCKHAPKVNGHCPSVDVLFESVAAVAGRNALGILLTGMGGDGAKGLLSMRKTGAHTIGQDESTCVVYGMPKVAYELGAVEYQEKLPDIARKTYQLINQ
jgi:two-component system chemotaxis response regulator CheB